MSSGYLRFVIFLPPTGCPRKNVADLIMASAKDLAYIDRKKSLNYSSILNLKIDTLFADIGALKEDIFIMKVKISSTPKPEILDIGLSC